MDPLMRLSQDHEKVSEYLDNLKEILSFIHDEEAWGKIKPIENFFKRKIVDHFKFEENKIFPTCLLNLATPESVKLILELQREHGVILTKLADFLRITSKNIGPPDKETIAELNLKGREIIDILLIHASKEDDKLIPIVEKNKHIFNK